MNHRHQTTGEVISEQCYRKLPLSSRYHYVSTYDNPTHTVEEDRDNSGEFLTSAIIGYATDSALIGGLAGGDMMGGIVGDMLNDSSSNSSSSSDSFGGFDGGDFGGGGASGDF